MKKGLYIRYKYSIVILLFLFGLKGFSQTDKVYFIPDSLKGKNYKELFEQENLFFAKREHAKALFYAKIYLHKAKNEKDTIRIANGYSQLGATFKEKRLGIKYSDSIILITKHLKNPIYPGFAYMTKGIFYFQIGEYKSSLNNYLKAQQYAIRNNNKRQYFYVSTGIADIKRIWGDYNEAITIYKSLLEEARKYNRAYLETLYYLSDCYRDLNKLDSALVYSQFGIKESLQINNKYWYLSFVKQTGYIFCEKRDFKIALDSLNKGGVNDENSNEYLNTYYYKGKIFSKLLKKSEAVLYFKKADSVYDANPDDIVPEIRDIQEYFVKYYGKKKDFENQLKYINRLLRVDSIMDSYKKNLNKTIDKAYDRPRLLAEKQTIIDGLEKDNKQSNYAIWGLIGLSLLILTLTVRFYYLQRQYKTRFNTLIQDTTKENTLEKAEIKEALDGISEHIITSVLNQLKTFEDETQFLDKAITLANLSKRFNTNSSYLSKIVNHYNDKNFNSYLTELRINYCVEQLQTNKTLRTYTIKAIAEEVGFKNNESFSKAFFKTTGIYPSYFIKQIEKQEKD